MIKEIEEVLKLYAMPQTLDDKKMIAWAREKIQEDDGKQALAALEALRSIEIPEGLKRALWVKNHGNMSQTMEFKDEFGEMPEAIIDKAAKQLLALGEK